MSAVKVCPICLRAPDEAPDAAPLVEPPPMLPPLVAICWRDITERVGAPCLRCAQRTTTAYEARGIMGALFYLATARTIARTLREPRKPVRTRLPARSGRRKRSKRRR